MYLSFLSKFFWRIIVIWERFSKDVEICILHLSFETLGQKLHVFEAEVLVDLSNSFGSEVSEIEFISDAFNIHPESLSSELDFWCFLGEFKTPM